METFDTHTLNNNPYDVYRTYTMSGLLGPSGTDNLEAQDKPPVSSLGCSSDNQNPSGADGCRQTCTRTLESYREASSGIVRIRIRKALVDTDAERIKIQFLETLGLQPKWTKEVPRRQS